LVALAGLSRRQREPDITLPPDVAIDAMLLEGRLLEPTKTPASSDLAVIRVLKVRRHVVQAGETLSQIAIRYGLRVGTLIDFNAIRDARAMPVGTRLAIPSVDGLRYAVRRGDSLSRIAQRYSVSLDAIRDWNDLQSDVIKLGQRLFIPGASLGVDDIEAAMGRLFIYPARGQLTSPFGMRISPIYKVEAFHNGIDLANSPGTPVVASRSGRVASVEFSPVYGKFVLLAHAGGYQTLYAHLDTVLVRSGQEVSQGQKLATMGNTGASVGFHVHFTVLRYGTPVDPLKLL
jgi:murein DD-endopeptidase MepM/ murein hydrolase activator NlpD